MTCGKKNTLKNEDNPTPEYNLTEKKILRCFYGDKEYETPVDEMDSDTGIHVSGRLIVDVWTALLILLALSMIM